jgi:DNA-binding transcriptional LysR family regulator
VEKQDRSKALEMALGQIEKQYGKGSVMRMGEKGTMAVSSISTGALPLDSDLAPGRRTVRPEELVAEPMIGQRAGDACQATLEGGMRKAGVEMDIVFRSNDNSAVQAMVRAGMGHAVMARLAVDCDDPGVLVRELVPSIPPRVITLVRRANSHPVPAAERFIELTHEVCGEIMPGAFAGVHAVA